MNQLKNGNNRPYGHGGNVRQGSFKWGEFLEARCELIHLWVNEGKSFAEISLLVSTTPEQIESIYAATQTKEAE